MRLWTYVSLLRSTERAAVVMVMEHVEGRVIINIGRRQIDDRLWNGEVQSKQTTPRLLTLVETVYCVGH